MMKKHIYIIGACSLLFLSGCNNDVVNPDDERVPIAFSAEIPSASVEAQTRATDFPNSGSIAVVAANATSTTPTWSSLYLDHVIATVGDKDVSSIYPVSFTSTQYWPFNPDEYLSFVAYSPITHSSLTHTGVGLTVDITGKVYSFPDLLYTAPVGPYNKDYNSYDGTKGKISLGDFKHAMSRLAVKVIVVDQDGNVLPSNAHPVNQLKISSLIVKTNVTQGGFDLVSSQWALTNSGTLQTVYTLASSSSMSSVPYDNTDTSVCYLLPSTSSINTVALSSITFKVKDNNTNIEVGGDYPLDQFEQTDGSPVTLEIGKTTILLIKLQYTAIPPISPTVQLQGQLVEWNYKGTSTVTIE